MKLYHFTPRHLLPGCQREGLTKGMTPLVKDGRITLSTGWQWLTSDASFDQPWCDQEFSTLPYDRTECRITVKIPKHYRDCLHNADEWVPMIKDVTHPHFFYENNYLDWFVFRGRVKPSWFRQVDHKPPLPQRISGAL